MKTNDLKLEGETEVSQSPNRAAVGQFPASELSGVGDCGLHRRTPYGMTNVRMTQLSIARHYGGITFNGDSYTYLPHTDELIRDDVLKWKTKQKLAIQTPNSMIKPQK